MIDRQKHRPERITVIGAGPAGLAVSYFLKKRGISSVVYEAGDRVGGNARTLTYGKFRFDTGAHRFHNRYPDLTLEIQDLLGDDLVRIDVPSQIVYGHRLIDFPLSPFNLLTKFGVSNVFRASADLARARLTGPSAGISFESTVLQKYGKTIAEAFLLAYSEKLWGVSADRLSPQVSGRRLSGLNARTFLIEAVRGAKAKTEHLDGTFFYPRLGIGMIMERLADACGREQILMESRVTRVHHNNERITRIEVNGKEKIPVTQLISTLPLSLLIRSLDPPPPQEIAELSGRIRFQNIILTALFINRPRITPNASLYFPDRDVPFTRVYEPKNRSSAMSPRIQTSLITEIPCNSVNPLWSSSDGALIDLVSRSLESRGLLKGQDVFDAAVYRIPFAYPVLEVGFEAVVLKLLHYLESFTNLKIIGRCGRFAYTHIHDLLYAGRQAAEDLDQQTARVVGSSSV